MTEDEQRVCDEATKLARGYKKTVCKELTDPAVFPAEKNPVSVFMAGSPGAGKTESSLELVAQFESAHGGARILRIDPDELRSNFPAYDGKNSWLFQRAVSMMVDRMLDIALDQQQSFILDGTLSDYDRAEANVERSLKRKRTVQILYVYLDPLMAWEFVQARETMEGRRIPIDRFVHQYFAARDVVNKLKTAFGPKIWVDLLLKPTDDTPRLYKAGIDQIDYHVPEKYDRKQLEQALNSQPAL